MITIEVNGIKVEAETMKEAQKLAKREEKRQAREETDKQGRTDIAYDRAFAHLGRLINADRAQTLSSYLFLSPDSGKTGGEDGRDMLHLSYPGGKTIVTMDSYVNLDVIGWNNSDDVVCVRLSEKGNSQQIYWYAVGGEGDSWAFVDIPEVLTTTLEKYWQNKLLLRYSGKYENLTALSEQKET